MGEDEGTAEQAVGQAGEAAAEEADHELVMAAALRIIATDAAIIHRLGTI